MRSLRVRVFVENRPTLPLRLARRLDRFNASGPSLMRFLKPQLMSGVSTLTATGRVWSAAAVANRHGLVRVHGRLHTQGC